MSTELSPETRIWRSLENIRLAIAASPADFSGRLGLTERQYTRYRDERLQPAVTSVFKLLKDLNLSFTAVMNGTIDYSALAAQHRGDSGALPERYTKAAFARRRTLLPVLSYVELFDGWEAKDLLLRRFQVSSAAFNNPDERVNTLLINDLFSHLAFRGYRPEQFFEIGLSSVIPFQGSPLANELASLGSVEAAYECLFTEKMGSFDENHDYRITCLTAESVTVRVTPRRAVSEALGVPGFGSLEVCMQKGGVGAAIPQFLGLPSSTMSKTRCVHSGDAFCEFVFDFPDQYDEKSLRAGYA